MDAFLYFADETLFLYISISSIYLFIFAVAAQFRRSKKYPKTINYHRYAVLVPEGTPALMMDYLVELRKFIPITSNWADIVLSLNEEEFDAVVILSETDQVSPNFLDEINNAFDVGVKIFQLHHRIEPRSSISKKLVALNEEIRNSFFKQGHTGVGFAASLDGVDMVFDLVWLKKNLKSAKTNLKIRALKQDIFVEYLEYVTVYSSKARKPRYVLSRGKAIARFLPTLFSGKWNYASVLFQRLIPSWGILLLLSCILAVFFTIISLDDSVKWWGMIFFLLFTMCLAIPDYLVEKKKKSKKHKDGK